MHTIPHNDARLASASDRLAGLELALDGIYSIMDEAQPLPGLRAAAMAVHQARLTLTLEVQSIAIPIAAAAGADLATLSVSQVTRDSLTLTSRAVSNPEETDEKPAT